MSTRIVVRPREPADDATFLAHYDHYIEELVGFGGSYARDATGRWQPDYLAYWVAPGDDHLVIIIDDDGRPAGFALVLNGRSPYIAAGLDYSLSEIYVAPGSRRHGVGSVAARAIFDRHPGRWELDVLPGNAPALRFWRRVLGEPTGGPGFRFDSRLRGS